MNPFNANDIVTASDDPTIAAHMAVAGDIIQKCIDYTKHTLG